MDDIQKELDKAEAFNSAGNFDKAAQTYLKVAKTVPNDKKYLKLLSNAYSAAKNIEKPKFVFEYAEAYFSALVHQGNKEKIHELNHGFFELSNRLLDQIETIKLDERIDILRWSLELHKFAGDQEEAYQISLQLGNVFFGSGKQLLSTSHLVGKEEKYNRGINLFSQAIETYKEVILNSESLKHIITVKLDKIAHFIDINRITEAIEDTTHLVRFFNDQSAEIHPYSKKILSLKIADLLASKSLEKVHKDIKIALALQKSAVAGFKEAKDFQKITPYMWTLSQIIDEINDIDRFKEFSTATFDAALKYKDQTAIDSIFTYLKERGHTICENIINSRMLLVKKGSIEFQNHRGVTYLSLSSHFGKKINDRKIVSNVAEYLFNYGKSMYEKKLRTQALPYLEFAGRTWWDLSENSEESKQVINFLEGTVTLFLSAGKLEEAANNLKSIIDLQTYFNDFKRAGESAFSFAKTIGQSNRVKLELEFLDRSFTNFDKENSTPKLIELLEYMIQRLDSYFGPDPKLKETRVNFLELAKKTAASISIENQGELLSGTTFKAINSDLPDLAITCANETFEIYKSYDLQLAADFYFNVGTKLLNIRQTEALDFLSESTTLAADDKSLEELVIRNLHFLKEEILKTPRLETKLILASQFEKTSGIVGKNELYQSFLFPFVKNLSENALDSDYFSTMNDYLMKVFSIFYDIDPAHDHLQEILEWTNGFISAFESDKSQLEMISLSLKFHERVNLPKQFLSFIWPIIEKRSDIEKYQEVLDLYQQTISFLKRVKFETEQFTEKFVKLLDRNQKSRIHDEKFDEAWIILKALYQILIDSGMKIHAVSLYKENALLFAYKRLDLALEQWISIVQISENLEDKKGIFDTIKSSITSEVLLYFKEQENTNAVLQLYNILIDINEVIGEISDSKDLILEVTRYLLTQGDYNGVFEWGNRGFSQAMEIDDEELLFNYSNLFILVGKGLLDTNPEVALKLITTASKHLTSFGELGFNYYVTKLFEIYGDLYSSTIGKELAISEKERILKHFKDTNNRTLEAEFLFLIAKINLNEEKISEGLALISKATTIFQELKDENNLSEIVSVCLAEASHFPIGSYEYESLSRCATNIQQGDIEISEEKTKDAFGDIFDGMMDDMTSLFDPKEKKKRQKRKKK